MLPVIISPLIRTEESNKPKLHFAYDAMGNRIAKTVTNKNVTMGDKYVTTYYVRDPQGNVLAVYEHKRGESGNGTFTLTEQHLYGAGRLGMRKRDLALNATNASESTPPVTHYELTNHLGNVMAVISDKASTTAEPTVVSLSDYYPFGMTEPGRSWNSGDYRFGYTGHEKENDLAEGVYTTEYRLLDTRLGRWMSVDPLFGKYPGMSPYNYCGGNPVRFIDLDGKIIRDKKGNIVYATNGDRGTFTHPSGSKATLEIGFVFADDGTPIKVFKNIDGDAGWDTNCHGTTFTDGKYWLNNDQVPTLLTGDGYKVKTIKEAKVGDKIVYDGDTDSEHSMTIVKTNGTMEGTKVYGQGGLEVENHTDKANEAWGKPQNSTIFRKEKRDKVASDEEIEKLRKKISNE